MNDTGKTVLGVVVPCYDEELALPESAGILERELRRLIDSGLISERSRIYLVDDGSRDSTWQIISDLAQHNPHFAGIKLARNYGHQHALYAGLMEADADAIVSLDADLQDDVAVIEGMLDSFHRGNEIVYGVRENRDSDTFFKRNTARLHYLLLSRMGVGTIPDHADFRLMSRRAVQFLSEYRETHLYLRGIVPLLGLSSDRVYYRRRERRAGDTKYSVVRMLGLSLRGLTSFSVLPLRIISGLGILVFFISSILGAWALLATFFGTGVVPGWASTVIPIYLLGGLQLLAIGVAGEYIGKTFIESKHRPLYQVEARRGFTDSPVEPGEGSRSREP